MLRLTQWNSLEPEGLVHTILMNCCRSIKGAWDAYLTQACLTLRVARSSGGGVKIAAVLQEDSRCSAFIRQELPSTFAQTRGLTCSLRLAEDTALEAPWAHVVSSRLKHSGQSIRGNDVIIRSEAYNNFFNQGGFVFIPLELKETRTRSAILKIPLPFPTFGTISIPCRVYKVKQSCDRTRDNCFLYGMHRPCADGVDRKMLTSLRSPQR